MSDKVLPIPNEVARKIKRDVIKILMWQIQFKIIHQIYGVPYMVKSHSAQYKDIVFF